MQMDRGVAHSVSRELGQVLDLNGLDWSQVPAVITFGLFFPASVIRTDKFTVTRRTGASSQVIVYRALKKR